MELVRFVDKDVPKKARKLIFVEGLPGVGNVGKLATQHLVDSLGADLWADIFSHDFPPQVTVQDDGTVRLVRNQLWFAKGAAGGFDIALLTGDFQPLSSEGQYALVEAILDRLESLGCKELYTLGGYGVGVAVEAPEVLGAGTDLKAVSKLRDAGVKFAEDDPANGIIGASGLFLGLGMMRGIRGACLMGETSGYLVDPRSARAVLEALMRVTGIEVSLEDLETKAQEIDQITRQLQDPEHGAVGAGQESDLHYIG